jgi:hypothetical protein
MVEQMYILARVVMVTQKLHVCLVFDLFILIMLMFSGNGWEPGANDAAQFSPLQLD